MQRVGRGAAICSGIGIGVCARSIECGADAVVHPSVAVGSGSRKRCATVGIECEMQCYGAVATLGINECMCCSSIVSGICLAVNPGITAASRYSVHSCNAIVHRQVKHIKSIAPIGICVMAVVGSGGSMKAGVAVVHPCQAVASRYVIAVAAALVHRKV